MRQQRRNYGPTLTPVMLAGSNGSTGTPARPFAEALRYVLVNYSDPVRGIDRGGALKYIAKQMVQEACNGNMQVIQELINRMDGKAAQAVTVESADGTALLAMLATAEQLRAKLLGATQTGRLIEHADTDVDG